jgi:hypothetical protein
MRDPENRPPRHSQGKRAALRDLLRSRGLDNFETPLAQGGVMTEIIFVVEEADEGDYIASALGASIVTEADTLTELRDMVRDAVRCHFDEGEAPKIIRLHFTREEVMAA